MDLHNKLVVITGASSGIGRACARRFASEGARLVLTARTLAKLEDLARELAPTETAVFPADLTQPPDLERLADHVLGRHGRVDVLVNNAGVGLYAPSYASEPEKVRRLFELNMLVPIELTRRLLPAIPAGGAIVNVSSIVGKVPLPWLSVYSASKFALGAYSDALRMELQSTGIHVLTVCPGYVATDFGNNVLQGEIPENIGGRSRFGITAEQCAEALVNGLKKGKRTVVTPRIGWLLVLAARLAPGLLHRKLAGMNPFEPPSDRR